MGDCHGEKIEDHDDYNRELIVVLPGVQKLDWACEGEGLLVTAVYKVRHGELERSEGAKHAQDCGPDGDEDDYKDAVCDGTDGTGEYQAGFEDGYGGLGDEESGEMVQEETLDEDEKPLEETQKRASAKEEDEAEEGEDSVGGRKG